MSSITANSSTDGTINLTQRNVIVEENSDVEIFPDPLESDETLPEIPEEFQHEARPKRTKYKKKSRLDIAKFLHIPTEHVNKIPWDVDGDHIYQIKCEPNQWIDKSRDGRWLVMNTSRRKGLIGTLKTGVCHGLYLCENTRCSKLLTEGVCNTNEFGQESSHYTCKSCGYFA